MATHRILAYTGLAGVLTGLLGLLSALLRLLNGATLLANGSRSSADILAIIAAVLFMTFFLLGLYGVQRREAGALGLAVIFTFVLGNMIFVGSEYMKLFMAPEVVAAALTGGKGMATAAGIAGLLLLIFNFTGMGYVIWRARVLPRWLGAYFILHGLVAALAGLLGLGLLVELLVLAQALIFAWVGWLIWSANGQLPAGMVSPA